MKKKIWGLFFLAISLISFFSFLLLQDKKYKMLIFCIISFFIGITELFDTENETEIRKKNSLYAKRAAEISLYSLFFLCIVGIILLHFNTEISRNVLAIHILEIMLGYMGSCYLGIYFILKFKERKNEK